MSVYADDFTSKVPNLFDTCSKQTFTGSMRPPIMRGSDQDPKDGKEGRVLNMVMRLTSPEIEIEAYPRQAEKLTGALKLEGAKCFVTSGTKAIAVHCEGDASLPISMHSPFRVIAAHAIYVPAGRSEVQLAAKAVCRWMASPTELSMAALKRLGRY